MTNITGGKRSGNAKFYGTAYTPVALATYEKSGLAAIPDNGAFYANVGWEGAFVEPFALEPAWIYMGKDANNTEWHPFAGTNAPVLQKVSNGGGLTFNNSTPFGAGQGRPDYSVYTDSSGDYYQSPAFDNLMSSDNDLIFVYAGSPSSGNVRTCVDWRSDSGKGIKFGYGDGPAGINHCHFGMYDGVTSAHQYPYASLNEYGWWHIALVFCDRNGSTGLRGNGWGLLEGGSANPTGLGDMNDPVSRLTLLSGRNGADPFYGHTYMVACWILPAGTINSNFSYTYANKLMQVFSSALSGYLTEKAPSYNTPGTWSRTGARRVSVAGTSFILTNYGIVNSTIDDEPGLWLRGNRKWNYATYSNNMTIWTKYDAGDTVTTYEVTADTTNGEHGVYRDPQAMPSAGTLMALSVEFDPAQMDRDWVRLSIANVGDCYFNVTTREVGTKTGMGNAGVFKVDGGYSRCWVQFNTDSGANTIGIHGAAGDNSLNFAGDGATTSLYIRHAQLELDSVTDWITTSGSVTSYYGEAFDLDANETNSFDGNPCGAFTMEVQIKRFGKPPADRSIMSMANSSNEDNRWEMRITSDGYAQSWAKTSVGSDENEATDADGIDICDGEWHTIRAGYDGNGTLKVQVDNGSITTATINTLVVQNWFIFNGDYARANNANCFYRRRKVFNEDILV